MSRAQSNWLIALALVGTVALGATMRAWFAGSGWLPLDFRHLRHAHTHLGWYGAIFPLAFGVWRADGWQLPGRAMMATYWVAVAVSTVGFVRAGYGPDAIAGSTGVLAVWLWVAFRNRHQVQPRRQHWSAAVPVLLVLAAMSIPPVAITLRRAPALSAAWVQTFLTLLLFGVTLPAALLRARFRAPPAWIWLVAVVAAAGWLGVLHRPELRWGPGLCGALLVGCAGLSDRARWDLRLVVGVAGLGWVAVAVGLLPFHTAVAVAGVHLVLLGPVLHGLVGPIDRVTPFSVITLGLLSIMCAAIWLPSLWPAPAWAQVAAWSGGALALSWSVWIVRWAATGSQRPSATGSQQPSATH
ncbi:MAG: hypothetical protein KC502_18535 [Myxococcales bacterium]|nr:hypothetical protein [Myxococcales bacterium]